jgi:hypothetical protein
MNSALFREITQRRQLRYQPHRGWRLKSRTVHLYGEANSSPASWPFKMGPTGCPETSVRTYHSTLLNILKECKSQLHRGDCNQWTAHGYTPVRDLSDEYTWLANNLSHASTGGWRRPLRTSAYAGLRRTCRRYLQHWLLVVACNSTLQSLGITCCNSTSRRNVLQVALL